MNTFQYHPDILARYPNVTGGAILAHGHVQRSNPGRLADGLSSRTARYLQRIGDTPLSQIETLAAWRMPFAASMWIQPSTAVPPKPCCAA